MATMNEDLRLLLRSGNLKASDAARADLESGRVDGRLVSLLLRLTGQHLIAVSTIKTGHPMGPRSPVGRENDHYFYRAVDITEVDGCSVESDPIGVGILGIGRTLMGLRGDARPARVMGPAAWHRALGSGDRTGFRSDEFANSIHGDHLHIGF